MLPIKKIDTYEVYVKREVSLETKIGEEVFKSFVI